MANNQDRSSSRYQLPMLIAIVLLVILGGFLIIRNLNTGEPGHVIPSQIDPAGGSGEGQGVMMDDTDSSLFIRLSEGQDQPEAAEANPLATGEPLSHASIMGILARLPELVAEPDDSQDFRLPDDVIPPPRTGVTIEETFPPDQAMLGPDPGEAGPLEVLRYSPEGEIPIAPFVNITFNQPMVALSTINDLAEIDVPVQIEPALSGTWRWLGTKTLNFQYDSELIDRMPMATEYMVTIPAGTQSATGGVLADTVQFSFSTPTVTMINYYPSSTPQPRDPLFFVAFNQRINPQAVLETIKVTAGNQQVSIVLATAEEIAQDKTVSNMTESANEGRWLVFRASELLPLDTNISILIGPGTPSAEGPLVTQAQQNFNFQTYAPLRIEDHGCAWYEDECPPLTPFFIEFNNPLDLDVYDDSMLRISPELPGAAVMIYGDMISIRGATEGRT
ncbi:MAG: Ig-like domain-containing protein, partial [Phycisphaerae bacterium]|nr:Ig-like domain-containing protein [Phycisphaerae bacterium]